VVGFTLGVGFVLMLFARQKLPTLTVSIQKLFYLATGAALFSSFFWPVPGPFNEELSLSFWQWTVGKEGLLYFGLVAGVFWQIRKEQKPFAQRLLAVLVTLHLTFFLWRLLNQFPAFMTRIDPNQLWWNQWKNSMMITMPLLTTIEGAPILIKIWSRQRTLGIVLVVFFALLQDPLVKQVGHGPFAPHAPRLSVAQSIDAMIWHMQHKPGVTSSDGLLHLNYLALPEPGWAKRVFAAEHERTQTVCMDSKISDGSYDLAFAGMQTLSFMTGARWKVLGLSSDDTQPMTSAKDCDFLWVLSTRQCPSEFYLNVPSASGKLCLKH
jgi:hypothetical protein